MKVRNLLLISFISLGIFGHGQLNNIVHKKNNFKELQQIAVSAPNVSALEKEDALRDNNGELYRIGQIINVQYTPENAGVWETAENGNKTWKIRFHSPKAEALSVFFDRFAVYGNSFVQVFSSEGKVLSDKFDASTTNPDHFMQHIALNQADDIVVKLFQEKNDAPAEIMISGIGYVYRSSAIQRNTHHNHEKDAGDSDYCQNNINCSVGSSWQNEKKGVARILVVDGNQMGWCTGSLVNNQAKDCKPYFLTALHCGVTSSAANLNQWRFYFNFEVSTCSGSPSENIANNNNTITGCVKKATSNDGGGNSGSDFLLVQLGSSSNEAATITKLKSSAINAYWNGWDANNTATSGGAGIHHPSGDVKKISLFNVTTSTQGWGASIPSHWMLTWADGVTEGGSSGSPLFNNSNKRIVGTLTGGSSYCNEQNSPDLYGKMSYHWDQNTSSGKIDLKNFLDPNNTGNKVIDGSYNPCEDSGTTPGNSPCASSSAECDEYIKEVKLNTLSNATSCSSYTFFSNKTTELARGQSYTIEVLTGILGNTQSTLYFDDHVSAWIDFNNDFTFSNPERVFYQAPTQANPNYNTQATFTVPANATLGEVYLRVKIGYQDNDPCGVAEYGEVEDYKIKIVDKPSALEENQINDLNIYPNPTKDILFFNKTSSDNELYQINIIDLTGKTVKVKSSQGLNNFGVDVRNLAKGMYQITILQGDKKSRFKFVKE